MEYIACNPAGLDDLDAGGQWLQSALWAKIKAAFGWKPLAVKSVYAGEVRHLLVLCRTLAPGFGLAYVPYPALPEVPANKAELLLELGRALAPLLPGNTRFIRFDPPWIRNGAPPLPGSGRLHKAPMDIQPPSTVLIDLAQTEDELLAGMKQKTRYNINLAERKGVKIVDASAEYERYLPLWYGLYRETAARDKIVLHSFAYYRELFRLTGSGPIRVKLLLANIEGETAAGIIVVMSSRQAVYLYGASGNVKRNYMPNHLLQWRAIQLARAAGCRCYDFFGIPEREDPGHPMYGLYRFKTGFGGKITHRYGSYDYSLSPVLYCVYRAAEVLRKWYYKRLRKILG